MKNRLLFPIILITSLMTNAMGQVPEFYKEIDQMLWVVQDLDKVQRSWQQLGFEQINNLGDLTIRLDEKSIPAKVAIANLGGFRIVWLQPNPEGSVLWEFLQSHGDGVISLVHRLAGQKSLSDEIDRLARLEMTLLGTLMIPTSQGGLNYVLMDTKKEGKYGLAYTFDSEGDKVWESLDEENSNNLAKRQYAFAISEPGPVSHYWSKLGFPVIDLTESVVRNKEYHGKPADFEMMLGWQRHGSIVYEWCIPKKGPTVYQDFMDVHGEGVQHIGFDVKDIDSAINEFSRQGFHVSMQGAWGEEGKKGSGRFAYVDLEQAGGVAIELLWSYRE